MAPPGNLELESRVLKRGVTETIGIFLLQAIDVRGVPLEGDVTGELGVVILAVLVAVVMVAPASDERHLPVNPFQRAADAFPHLDAALVEHATVQGVVLVLLHQVAGAEHGLNVEVLDIICDPEGCQLEYWLVNIVLDIPLRIPEENKG